jgi:hypothetical protein
MKGSGAPDQVRGDERLMRTTARWLFWGGEPILPHIVAPCLTRGLAFLSRGLQQCSNDGKRRLGYAERHDDTWRAIAREKLVKTWRRERKFVLIEVDSPDWDDLWDKWFGLEAQEG